MKYIFLPINRERKNLKNNKKMWKKFVFIKKHSKSITKFKKIIMNEVI